MRILLVLSIVICSFFNLNAQTPHRASSSDIYFKIKQLNNLANVLYIAAHPDDENTHLLTYLIHEEGVKTTYYSLTRGDGGQNILGTELGVALGVIRTMEMYEARKIDGAQQRFGTAFDFGFSKNPEETFKFWDKQKLVDETIELIQELKPELIICRFPTTGEGGHGHHTASAIIALEAFRQIEQYNNSASDNDKLWLPKRLLFNSYQFRTASTIKNEHLKLPLNQFNSIIGKSYSQIAGESRSVHHSQGVGTPQRFGITTEHFGLVAGDDYSSSIWDGIDKTWNKVQAKRIQKSIQKVLDHFDFKQPAHHIQQMLSIRKMIVDMPNHEWKTQKLLEVDDILLDLMAVRIELNTKKESYTSSQFKEFELKVIQESTIPFTIKNIQLGGQELISKQPVFSVQSQQFKTEKISINPSVEIPYSQAYWLQKEDTITHFPLMATVTFLINNDIEIKKDYPITHYYLDPIWGDKYQFTRIEPDGQIEIDNDFVLRSNSGIIELPLWLRIVDQARNVELELYYNNQLITQEQIVWNQEESSQYHLWNIQTDTQKVFEEGDYQVVLKWVDVKSNQQKESRGVQKTVQYEHIPTMPYFKGSTIRILNNDFKHKVHNVAYIDGVGDKVSDVLQQIGLNVKKLDPAMIKDAKELSEFEAIIIGIRAYNRVPVLNDIQNILKEYAENGGRIIVQYNTNHELISEDIGFKPLKLSRDRVTEEDSEVKFIDPLHPVLNYPHQLTSSDFEGWVQERGLYFPSEWDSAYQSILEMSDSGENAKQGALLVLPYGKGSYIYTGLSFFRQLPAGQKGALKLFLNILEYQPEIN